MKADYDSGADALSIALTSAPRASHAEEISDRCNVAVDASDRAVALEILHLDEPFEDLLRIAAERFDLDAEALIGIARAAVAAPDREVTLRLGARATA